MCQWLREKEPKNANRISIEVSQSVFSMSDMARAVLEASRCSKEVYSTVSTLQQLSLSMWEVTPTFETMRE